MNEQKPDLHLRGINYRPHEEEARELAAHTMQAFTSNAKGMIIVPAHVMAELLVGNSFDGFTAGLARGMRIYQDAESYLQGINDGREIERRKIDGYDG